MIERRNSYMSLEVELGQCFFLFELQNFLLNEKFS